MRTLRALAAVGVAAWLLCQAGIAHAEEGPGWIDIELDGRSHRAEVVTIEGERGRAAPGDLVRFADYLFTRGTEARLRLRREPGRLFQIDAAGKETLMGVVLRPEDEPEDHRHGKHDDETLRPLSKADAARVRGVQVFGEPSDVAAMLARLDLSIAAVRIESGEPEVVASRLPVNVRFLSFEGQDGGEGPADLKTMSRLTALRSLALGSHFDGATDLGPLGGLAALQHLDLSWRDVSGTEGLRGLKALRFLDASLCDGFNDLAPLAGLERLVSLDLGFTTVTDLAPLAGLVRLETLDLGEARVTDLAPLKNLPALTELEATGTRVKTLPADGFAALRSLKVLCTPIPKADVVAFRARHPACEVLHDRLELLLAALKGVDRIQLSHAWSEDGPPITVVKDPKDVAALIAKIELEEPVLTGSCCCPGHPHFEFYAGEKPLARLSMHHGIALRWDDGPWPGDGPLSPRSQVDLCAWLTSVGVPRPGEELKDHQKTRKRVDHWKVRSAALLGPDVAAAIADVRVDVDEKAVATVGTLLEKHVPDRDARALLFFRLMGASGLEWQAPVGAGRNFLEELGRAAVRKAALAALREDEGALGVGVWLFAEEAIEAEGLDELVRAAALRCLADADPEVRALAMQGLVRYPGPTALALLRGVLAGQVPGGAVGGSPTGGRADSAYDLQEACWALLKVGDLESLPRMRELAAAWPEETRKAFEEQVQKAQERAGK